MSIQDYLIGDTVKVTWVNSGVSPSSLTCEMVNESGTVVNTDTLISSGNGHYYAYMTIPDSRGYYAVITEAQINSYPFKRSVKLRAVTSEV